MPETVSIEMYSRPQCHLCDEAKEVIERVRRQWPFTFRVINIEEDPKLEQAYGLEVPVILINGNKAFKYRVDEADLIRKVRRLWKT